MMDDSAISQGILMLLGGNEDQELGEPLFQCGSSKSLCGGFQLEITSSFH